MIITLLNQNLTNLLKSVQMVQKLIVMVMEQIS